MSDGLTITKYCFCCLYRSNNFCSHSNNRFNLKSLVEKYGVVYTGEVLQQWKIALNCDDKLISSLITGLSIGRFFRKKTMVEIQPKPLSRSQFKTITTKILMPWTTHHRVFLECANGSNLKHILADDPHFYEPTQKSNHSIKKLKKCQNGEMCEFLKHKLRIFVGRCEHLP